MTLYVCGIYVQLILPKLTLPPFKQLPLDETSAGIIDEIPKSLCEKLRGTDEVPAKQGKNVILVVG